MIYFILFYLPFLEKRYLYSKIKCLLKHNMVNSKEITLGGWGTEGSKSLTIGQFMSVYATILLGNGSVYLALGLG